MGQQQIVLIVLGIVIAGLAVYVGFIAYNDNSVKSNLETMTQDVYRIASDAQVWKTTPAMFGGSPDDSKAALADYSSLSFIELGYARETVSLPGTCLDNRNGQYVLFPLKDGLGILATNVELQNMVAYRVTGILEADVRIHEAPWNPVEAGVGADGNPMQVLVHERCGGGDTSLAIKSVGD